MLSYIVMTFDKDTIVLKRRLNMTTLKDLLPSSTKESPEGRTEASPTVRARRTTRTNSVSCF